jgi:CRP-like cAMP-binding protein
MTDPMQTISIFQREQPKQFAAGEVIFQQGDHAEHLYGVLEGEVEMRVEGKPLELIKAGDMFGEGALIHSDRKRTSTAIAKTDCTLAMLDERRFLFVVQETPMFAIDVMRSYSDRMRRMRLLLV